MGIAIFPHAGQSFGTPTSRTRLPVTYPPVTYPRPARARPNLSPQERVAAQQVPGRLARRLTSLGVYTLGVLISASIGPLIYAIGDRDNAVRWAFDALDLLGKF